MQGSASWLTLAPMLWFALVIGAYWWWTRRVFDRDRAMHRAAEAASHWASAARPAGLGPVPAVRSGGFTWHGG